MNYEFLFALPLRNLPYLLVGAWFSLQLAFLASTGGILTALLICYALHRRWPVLAVLARGYVEVMRNTPLLVQLFLAYFGLPSLGINLSPTPTAVLVLTLNNGAYMAEIIRGGTAGVAYGQNEAGLSLGMGPFQVFRYVVLPPALQNVAPALANQFIALTLATSLASQIAADELTYRATLLEARIFHSFEIYAITLVIYFILAQVLMRVIAAVLKGFTRPSGISNIPLTA
jgi:polar amino acid transport system permease protein